MYQVKYYGFGFYGFTRVYVVERAQQHKWKYVAQKFSDKQKHI